MTIQAELTLLGLRLIQGPSRPPIDEWLLFPRFLPASHREAVAFLAASPKPVLVAPLIEPGAIALWSPTHDDSLTAAAFAQELAKRVEYFDAKLLTLWPSGIDTVRLADGTSDGTLSLPAFREWLRDYYLFVGVGFERDPEPRTARLILRVAGGGRRPIGLPPGVG